MNDAKFPVLKVWLFKKMGREYKNYIINFD